MLTQLRDVEALKLSHIAPPHNFQLVQVLDVLPCICQPT